MSLGFLSLALLATVHATPIDAVARDACEPCNPQGATGTNPPTIGSELKSMYIDLLGSVKDIHFRKRWTDLVLRRADGFCCRETLECVNVENLNIPMCYDKFTTQYAFQDGSWGSLTTGEYNREKQDGSVVNLISGEYSKAGGEKGDIYSDDPGAKPNTATLSIPPQWTGTGVGSAIPATELASVVVGTTTVDGVTITAPTVIPESTIFETISGQTTAVTTIPARTITAPTVIPPATSVVASSQNAAAPSSSSTGAAGQIGTDSSVSFGVLIFTWLMHAVYAL